MDFDSKNGILYTADEMGYIQRWDLSSLFAKLADINLKESKGLHKRGEGMGLEDKIGIQDPTKKGGASLDAGATFVTGLDAMGGGPIIKSKVEFNGNEDAKMVFRWQAHTDTINYLTYVPDLNLLASCSFDCNVYMWKWSPSREDFAGEMVKIGSLVLGTDRLWNIKIDKQDRIQSEKEEAEQMLQEVEQMSIEELFAHKKKEATTDRPLVQALKAEHDELRALDK